MSFKLTYATMFDPPADMHARFEAALARSERSWARRTTCSSTARTSPRSARRSQAQPDRPATWYWATSRWPPPRTPTPRWPPRTPRLRRAGARRPVAERVRLLRRVARLIEERVYEIAAALTLEVGKNRMEALGEVQETADFFDLLRRRVRKARRLRQAAARTIRCRTSARATRA